MLYTYHFLVHWKNNISQSRISGRGNTEAEAWEDAIQRYDEVMTRNGYPGHRQLVESYRRIYREAV